MLINYILYKNYNEIENIEIKNKNELKKILIKEIKKNYKINDLISINYFNKSNTIYIHLYKKYKSIDNLKLSFKINIYYYEKIKIKEILNLIKEIFKTNNLKYEIKKI